MEVVVNRVKESICYLYNTNDVFIGKIESEIQLLDVLVQINTNKLEGYYVLYYSEDIDEETGVKLEYKLSISSSGYIHKPPRGFFDKIDDYLRILIGF